MGKVVAWLVGKLFDKAFDLMIAGLTGLLAWLVYSPFWDGWRAICIGISAAGIGLGLLALRRRENLHKSDDHRRQRAMTPASDMATSPHQLKVCRNDTIPPRNHPSRPTIHIVIRNTDASH